MLAGLLNVSIMWLLNGEGEGIDPPDKINGRLQDANDLFLELRSLRAQFKQSSDRLGAIENASERCLDLTPNDETKFFERAPRHPEKDCVCAPCVGAPGNGYYTGRLCRDVFI